MAKDFKQLLEEIARNNQTTPEKVYKEMEAAISFAYENPDPKVRDAWAKIPHKGERPTPEEVIVALAGQVLGKGPLK